jgi:hypothetical protein
MLTLQLTAVTLPIILDRVIVLIYHNIFSIQNFIVRQPSPRHHIKFFTILFKIKRSVLLK